MKMQIIRMSYTTPWENHEASPERGATHTTPYSAFQYNFLQWWISVLSNTVTTKHVWLLSNQNMVSVTENLNFILI